ncbi:hypothetical protein COLO4_13642 [Corchorus olitorius]|uniref:Uncharacterized protein n=1 Tax=Corchorus olitorius TaxID=93759 RepID=A0A1R3JVI5_9ROSI|nr:hypothetical protein COLO4_13642 [Corchorus olitorius]
MNTFRRCKPLKETSSTMSYALLGGCICHWEPDKDQLALLLKDRNERENANLIR